MQQHTVVSVLAVHVAQTLDIDRIPTQTLFGKCVTKQTSPNSILVQLGNNQKNQYAALYRFGSIVYFNFDSTKHFTEILQKDALLRNDTVRSEQFDIVLTDNHPTEETQTVTGDYCLVDQLDMNNVAVISNIMAQTVALDSYSDIVDDLLHNFASINSTVTKTGSFSSTDKSSLFKTVAQNNSIFIDMISKIGIKDRSDTVWNMTKYETIHYGLKEEFEIEDRFQNIEFKLNLIQKNAKFFLEVLHHQKSNNLEWIIVVLILLECVLMIVEMSGTGEAFFQSYLGSGWLLSSFGGGSDAAVTVTDLPDPTPQTDGESIKGNILSRTSG